VTQNFLSQSLVLRKIRECRFASLA